MAGGCAPPIFVPPAAPGAPAPEAAAAWREATARCAGAASYGAVLRFGGRIGGRRVAGLQVAAALVGDGRIRLEGTAFGRDVFTLAGTAARADLYLSEESRLVTAEASSIVEALLGAPLTPQAFLAVLTGCAVTDHTLVSGVRRGPLLAVTTPQGTVYLAVERGVARTRAAELESIVIEYRKVAGGLPAEIGVWTRPGADAAVGLRVGVEQAALNETWADRAFERPRAADRATPMSLDEFRARGPLGRR